MIRAMAGSDVAQALRSTSLFAKVPDKELDRLAGAMRERRVSAGEEILSEGTGGVGFFVIESGEATVTQDGTELRTLGPGEGFGEMSLIDQKPRSATVRASSDMVCHGITAWEFRPLVEEQPALAWSLLETLVARLRAAEARAGG